MGQNYVVFHYVVGLLANLRNIWHHLCCFLTSNRLDIETTEAAMKPGDPLKTSKAIRSQKTGVLLPREGTFVRAIENLGRELILVNFGTAGYEYLFPEEILPEPSK